MTKPLKYSAVASEIKKEYLKEHLEKVREEIETWIFELATPSPFAAVKGIWGWQEVYRPTKEYDPDSNHILRRHLRSRALWHHHAEWERKLEGLWQLKNRVNEDADKEHEERLYKKVRSYTESYIPSAVWQGFEIAKGREIYINYKIPDDRIGVSYGAYRIENSVQSADDRALVEKEHKEFSKYIAGTKIMEKLVTLWKEIQDVQKTMYSIADKTFKSHDIFYPCRFCKHLWK